MITQVRDLQEALARFNPDAKLNDGIEVIGNSVAYCTVSTLAGDDLVEELRQENKDQFKRIDELQRALREIQNVCELQNALMEHEASKESFESSISKITAALEKADFA